MFQLAGNSLALACSDPAGANACMAIANMQELNGNPSPVLFTNRDPGFSGNMNFRIKLVNESPDFKALGFDYLFTGTSHPDSSNFFECKCILNALKEGIHTISFIDHWVNFKVRFSGLPENIYPDEIWVVDETAKTLAIDEGLPKENLIVRGNPYHYYLKNYWRSAYQTKEYLLKLGINANRNVILFAPDPISTRPGKEIIGFTETEALNDILEVLNDLSATSLLLIKLHPLQSESVIKKSLGNSVFKNYYILQNADIPELINASDIVLGFYSNILLDAWALKKPVIRYFPGFPEKDLLKYSNIERPLLNKDDLKNKLDYTIGRA